ncbi:hypothetical protein M011DRAFT_530289 [Sporormia fimetaria CBS 119925]|uniref:Ubiquitin-like protease family profile domain-containing protein n=1 Tax=Sporormia fimetaria CBS 119925 TaxID=1340428 RepID=A0A6A6UVG6_9PLEO|nr:hypothetical protein M011DRAFT_530289 [Sporormia fimetaria CBS 119925]
MNKRPRGPTEDPHEEQPSSKRASKQCSAFTKKSKGTVQCKNPGHSDGLYYCGVHKPKGGNPPRIDPPIPPSGGEPVLPPGGTTIPAGEEGAPIEPVGPSAGPGHQVGNETGSDPPRHSAHLLAPAELHKGLPSMDTLTFPPNFLNKNMLEGLLGQQLAPHDPTPGAKLSLLQQGAHLPVETPSEINWVLGARQGNSWSSSIFVVLNAWALAMGLSLNTTPHERGRDRTFFHRARRLIHLARTGQPDWRLIYAFLVYYQIAEPTEVPACHRFARTRSLPTIQAFRGYLTVLNAYDESWRENTGDPYSRYEIGRTFTFKISDQQLPTDRDAEVPLTEAADFVERFLDLRGRRNNPVKETRELFAKLLDEFQKDRKGAEEQGQWCGLFQERFELWANLSKFGNAHSYLRQGEWLNHDVVMLAISSVLLPINKLAESDHGLPGTGGFAIASGSGIDNAFRAIDEGWADYMGVNPAGPAVAIRPRRFAKQLRIVPVRQQTDNWECGLHTILNAWIFALGLAPAANGSADHASSAKVRNEMFRLLRCALNGRLDWKTLAYFLLCNRLVQETSIDNVPASRRFALTQAHRGGENGDNDLNRLLWDSWQVTDLLLLTMPDQPTLIDLTFNVDFSKMPVELLEDEEEEESEEEEGEGEEGGEEEEGEGEGEDENENAGEEEELEVEQDEDMGEQIDGKSKDNGRK